MLKLPFNSIEWIQHAVFYRYRTTSNRLSIPLNGFPMYWAEGIGKIVRETFNSIEWIQAPAHRVGADALRGSFQFH
jgi:hypothetical protein